MWIIVQGSRFEGASIPKKAYGYLPKAWEEAAMIAYCEWDDEMLWNHKEGCFTAYECDYITVVKLEVDDKFY